MGSNLGGQPGTAALVGSQGGQPRWAVWASRLTGSLGGQPGRAARVGDQGVTRAGSQGTLSEVHGFGSIIPQHRIVNTQ